jgi:hypothetical protein
MIESLRRREFGNVGCRKGWRIHARCPTHPRSLRMSGNLGALFSHLAMIAVTMAPVPIFFLFFRT